MKRKRDYVIYDPAALDDVTLSADFLNGKERLESADFWEKLAYVAGANGLTFQGIRPADFLNQVLVGNTDYELPIGLKLLLAADDSVVCLAYLYDSYVELHLPEVYLLTGCMEEDVKRRLYFWKVAENFGKAIDVTWTYVEWAGEKKAVISISPLLIDIKSPFMNELIALKISQAATVLAINKRVAPTFTSGEVSCRQAAYSNDCR